MIYLDFCLELFNQLKTYHIIAYENSSDELSDQGQGHGLALKFFSSYHNANCQVLCPSFGT